MAAGDLGERLGKLRLANPYLFNGRRVDILENGSLTIQSNRQRHYDYYTG